MVVGILAGTSARSTRVDEAPPWEFLLPESSCEPETTRREWQLVDERAFIVSLVLRKTMDRNVDTNGYARLKTVFLRRALRRHHLKDVLQNLEGLGRLEIDRSYCVDHYSRGYRLPDHQCGAGHVRFRPRSPEMRKKLAKLASWHAENQAVRRKPIHDDLNDIQVKNLFVEGADAQRILAGTLPKARLCQGVLLENLGLRRLGNSVSSTGRYFNAITGLKRELRRTLRLAGRPMGAIDLRCAQPAFLGMLIQGLIKPNLVYKRPTYKHALAGCLPGASLAELGGVVLCSPLDARRFMDLVSSGEFYAELSRLAGVPVDGDSGAKHRFLVDVLARKGRYMSGVREVFSTEFPGVARLVELVNSHGYCTLIRLLQRLESWLVIETVAPRLVCDVPIVTLHDAVCGRVDDLDHVMGAFSAVFDEIGFRFAMKRELWLPESATDDAVAAA
jgi:hypothetical protein